MSKWQEITVETTEEASEAVANLFYDVGAAGVVIEDPQVIARYLEENLWDAYEFPAELVEAENVIIKGYLPIDDRLQLRLDLFKEQLVSLEKHFVWWLAKLSLAEIAEADWSSAWKAYYKPEKIGTRITVSPSWENYEAQDNELVVRLDPGMAFGTGNHPTTAMVIRALEHYLQPGDRVIDIGTGSGILAVTAAKLGAGQVLALDVDTLAVQVAEQNVELNQVEGIVTVRYNDLLTGINEQADLISANIIADVVMEVAEQAREKLAAGGVLILSGVISSRQADVKTKLAGLGYRIEEITQEDDWYALVARKV